LNKSFFTKKKISDINNFQILSENIIVKDFFLSFFFSECLDLLLEKQACVVKRERARESERERARGRGRWRGRGKISGVGVIKLKVYVKIKKIS